MKRASEFDRTSRPIDRRSVLRGGAAAALGSSVLPTLGMPAIAQGAPIRIGVITSLSGVFTSLGNNMLKGINLFFEENEMKVAGRKIEIIVEDEEGNPQAALRKARKLVEQDNVDFLTGIISSAAGYALKEYAARIRKVYISAGGSADGIFKVKNNSPYAYRASVSSTQANKPMGSWLVEQGFKRLFTAAPDYAMGHEAIGAASDQLDARGLATVGKIYCPVGTNDFAPYMVAIKNAEPDVVYSAFAGSDAVRFVQQFAAFGLKSKIRLAGFGVIAEEDTIPAQGEAALGIVSGLNWAYGLDTPENKTFVAKYRAKYQTVPTNDSQQGYVAANIAFNALQSMNGVISSQEAFSEAVLKTNITTPRGPVSFDPETRNVIQNIYIREVMRIGDELHNGVLKTWPSVRDPGL